MTASLPDEVQQVLHRFVTTEYTTIDRRGQPITWPVVPYYKPGAPCVDVSTGLGYPKKAEDARANDKVGLLFSDPTGSRLESPPMIFIQGTADVDDRDLRGNYERYMRESVEKLPATKQDHPPRFVRRFMDWYYMRIYVHVRPERVYVWPNCDVTQEPQLYDSHMEEVRSTHDEEPDAPHAKPDATEPVWADRLDEIGQRYDSAVLSLVAPDGFPFSFRVPVEVDRAGKAIRIAAGALGVPVQSGLACLVAHEHEPDFRWQRNFQVRGDLVEDESGWKLIPHKFVGGLELPPESFIQRYRMNAKRIKQMRKNAKRELREREAR